MNRLKFRVWDKLAQRFIYPDRGYQGHYVLSLNGEFTNLQNGAGGDDFVVQQWTGLKDANCMEIYEGDVVVYDYYEGDAVVKWDDYDGVYYLDGDTSWIDLFSDGRKWHRCRVVGNIFENKGLLNG